MFESNFIDTAAFVHSQRRHACLSVSVRNGGVHEESGQHGRGADGGGEEPAVCSLQERDRSQKSIVADNQQSGAKRRKQRRRGQTKNDPRIQENGQCEQPCSGLFQVVKVKFLWKSVFVFRPPWLCCLICSSCRLFWSAGWKGAEVDLQRHPGCTGQAPHFSCNHGRVQGFLLQNVGKAPKSPHFTSTFMLSFLQIIPGVKFPYLAEFPALRLPFNEGFIIFFLCLIHKHPSVTEWKLCFLSLMHQMWF